MRIAVDFDKTLTQGDESYFTSGREEPNELLVSWVQAQYTSGHTIFIHTARPERVRPQTEAWLAEEDVPYHALVMDKLSADLYVDDKSVQPSDAGMISDAEDVLGHLGHK